MGKKTGQAQRVKGNVQPSSSAKAAEIIQQISSGFVGFNLSNDVAPIGVGTLLEDAFDSSIDSDFRMSLKKLYKKDALTKFKALEEFKGLVDTKSQEDCVAILPYWSKSYTKLTLDADRKVRETAQQTHEKLCSKVNKSLAPHLKTIMPYWILAQADTYQQASKIAEACFKSTFNETKQPEVVYFAREEILTVLHDLLLVQTAKTLSDMKTCSEDEAQQKHETVVCNSLRGLDLFLRYFFQMVSAKKAGAATKPEESASAASPEKAPGNFYDKLNALIFDQKFWKYSKDPSSKVKTEFFQLLSSMIDVVLLNSVPDADESLLKLSADLRAKLVPLVFYSCDEDAYSSCFYIWSAIAKCLRNLANEAAFWSLFNVKKTFLPKLYALLRHHANGTANSQNVDAIYSALPVLVKQIQSVFGDESERLEFHTELYARMYDGVVKEGPKMPKTRFAGSSNKIKILEAFFECLYFTIKTISESGSPSEIQFGQLLTTSYVLNLTYQYMEGNQTAVLSNQFGFESKFKDFLENIIQKSSVLKSDFWAKLAEWLSSRLNWEKLDAESIAVFENILSNFCCLFEPFWRVNQAECPELARILASVFKELLSTLNSRLSAAGKGQDAQLQTLTSTLGAVKKLSVNFANGSLLDYFLADQSPKTIDTFNDVYLVDLFIKAYKYQAGLESDVLTFELLDLLLIVNANFDHSASSLVGLIDKFLFGLNAETPFSARSLVGHYFASRQENLVMVKAKTKALLFEWFLTSEKFHAEMLENFFNSSSLFNTSKQEKTARNEGQNEFKLVIQFMDGLNKFHVDSSSQLAVKKSQVMRKLNESLVQTIIEFIEASLAKQQQTANEASVLRWIRKNASGLNELNNLVLFALEFLFGQPNKWSSSFELSIDKTWSMFINGLQLKAGLDSRWRSIETSAAGKPKVKDAMSALPDSILKNLNELLTRTSSRLAEHLSKPETESYQPFISYRNKTIDSKSVNNLKAVTLGTIGHLEKALPRELRSEWMLKFYTKVLFSPQGGFESYETILDDLLVANDQRSSLVSADLMTKIYMSERFGYLYSRFNSQLALSQPAPSVAGIEPLVRSLLQIEYGLAILVDYFSQPALDGHAKFLEMLLVNEKNEQTRLKLVEVVNLLICTMVLDFHDPACLFSSDEASLNEYGKYLLKSIRSKVDKLFLGTEFLKLLFASLNGSNESLSQMVSEANVLVKLYQTGHLSPTKHQIKLNSLSMLMGVLVELGLENRSYLMKSNLNYLEQLNQFVQHFIRSLASNGAASQANLKELQYYLYDLPFAKYLLVSSSLDEGKQDSTGRVKFFYGLLSQLVEPSLGQIVELANQLKLIDPNLPPGEKDNLHAGLSKFNFHFDIFLRNIQVYLEILVKNSSTSSDLSTRLLNVSEETLVYLTREMARYINEAMSAFIGLKSAIAGFANNQGGYSFFYDLDAKAQGPEDAQVKWQQFLLLHKLNSFMRLFFKDFKLYLKRTSTNQVANTADDLQLSQLLTDKHWDFILCYLASLTQRLNKIERFNEAVDEAVPVKILAVGLFDLVYALAKCVRVRVRDNKPGTYPKSIYADWSGFFAKEIFDPLLCLFVKVADHYADAKRASCARRSSVTLRMVRNLCASVSLIPAERLVFNDLEPKFSVLDSNSAESVLHFTDALKTVFNHVTPHLKHDIGQIKLAAYKILKEIMKKTSQYYARVGKTPTAQAEEDNEEEEVGASASGKAKSELNIIESLPQVVQQVLKQNLEVFAGLKNNVQFDQSVLINELDQDQEEEEEESDEPKADEEAWPGDGGPDDRQSSLNENYAQSLRLDQMRREANEKLMTNMLVSRLILDMFSSDNLEFNVKLVNNLREMNFNEILVHFLFRVMPAFRNASVKLFAANLSPDLEDLDELHFEAITNGACEEEGAESKEPTDSFTNRQAQLFACKLYKYALKNVPAMIRDWWNIQPKRIADYVDKYTTKYVSPVLLEEEIRVINRYNVPTAPPEPPLATSASGAPSPKKPAVFTDDDDQSSIKIRGMLSSREVVSTYKMKELNMELIIHLPVNHPLGIIEVSSVRRIGVDEKQWRNWLLQLTTYLTHQNGSITQSLLIWKKNVDKKFSGVEECTICYNVIHGTNYQLPKIKCRTCRKLFHSVCLYKWFESSSKSTCPLCRNLFYF